MGFPIAARFAHPGNGYEADQELAAKHLTPGRVYVLTGIDVGRTASRLFLDIPDGPVFGFNTVMFEPASVYDEDGEADGHEDGGDPLGEQQRWQVDEAALLLAAWDQEHGPEIAGRERVLADQVRALLAVIGQAAPDPAPVRTENAGG